MNVNLDNGEQYLIQKIAQVVAEEIRAHVLRDLYQAPLLWSKRTTAQMIGGEHDHASVRFVEDLIADGQIEAIRTGLNGGGRTWVVPESVEAWKKRELLKLKRRVGRVGRVASS